MDFIKSKMGILTIIICALLLAAVVWFCLDAASRPAQPDGTLVEYRPVTAAAEVPS